MVGGETARDDNQGAEPGTLAAIDNTQPIGAIAKSEITARHDAGSDANETIDGLNDTDEIMRRAAEEVTIESGDLEDVPVFDRGNTLPRI